MKQHNGRRRPKRRIPSRIRKQRFTRWIKTEAGLDFINILAVPIRQSVCSTSIINQIFQPITMDNKYD